MNLWIRGMEWGRHYWHSAASNICPTLTPVATKGTTIMRMTDEDLLQHDNCISTMTPSLIEPLRGGEKDTSFSLSSVAPSSGLRLLMTRLHRLKAHFLAFKKKHWLLPQELKVLRIFLNSMDCFSINKKSHETNSNIGLSK